MGYTLKDNQKHLTHPESASPNAQGGYTHADEVDHPAHYISGGLESIDVIEAFDLGFHRGNAVKYILRAGKKGSEARDLEKAVWYLRRRLQRISD